MRRIKVIIAAILFAIAFFFILDYFFPEKDNWHIYSLIIIELVVLFFYLNEDFIEEIIINTSTRKIEIYYYNIYQNKMQKTWDLTGFSTSVESSFIKKIIKIDFYRGKYLGFTLKKEKDNFSQQSLEEIYQVLQELQLIRVR